MKNDNYFDMFGDFLFGNDDDDDKLNKMYEEILKGLDKMSKEGKSSQDIDDYLKKIVDENNDFTLFNQINEILDIQNKIEMWLGEGLTPDELDGKIVSEIGNPESIGIRKYEDTYTEEKIWIVSGSLLVRTKEMSPEEIQKWEADGRSNYVDSDDLNINEIYDLNELSDYGRPKQLTLEEQLKNAVENEEYEKAAELRDKIKGVEKPEMVENQKIRKVREKK